MSKFKSRAFCLAIISTLLFSLLPGFARRMPDRSSSVNNSLPQESVSLHLTLGNPSGATDSTSDKNNFLMVKPQFVLSYNNSGGEPNWVSWHLQKSDIGNIPRHLFHPDGDLPAGFVRIVPADYTGSGFDRGHVCNAKDRSKTNEDNIATFSMTNMLPQTADLNRGPWVKLENYSRTLVNQGNELYIVAGGFGSKKKIAHGKVNVPTDCWKVIVVLRRGNDDLSRIDENTRVIAVDMPNKTGIKANDWRQYITTVRDIESSTGYDLLSEVPKSIQDVIETKKDTGRATPRRNNR